MRECIRWGILGTGQMARKFAQGLEAVEGAGLAAVASRSASRAEEFVGGLGAVKAYGSYEQLLSDPAVDVVYVSTPISEHYPNMLLCLEYGKPVLCEKAFTVNAGQAERLAAIARQKGLFLMEAMWMRFLPAMLRVREWLADGVIGDIRMITGNLGFIMDYDPKSLLFNPQLAGGALLSIGVYAVSFASMVMGVPPVRISTLGRIGDSGVDEDFTLLMGYGEGQMASFASSIRTRMSQEGCIYGDKGYIRLSKFFAPRSAELWLEGREPETFQPDFPDNGCSCEAAEAGRCLREGKTECAGMPLDETVAVMRTMDEIRRQWSLHYPCE